jgi:carbamoyltransferase
MSIIGFQISHTSGIAIYHEGDIVFAASEERYTKVKNETLFPYNAVKKAYEFIEKNNIPKPKKAVIATENLDFSHFVVRREATFSINDYIKEQTDFHYPKIYENKKINYLDAFEGYEREGVLSDEDLNFLKSAENPTEAFRKIRAKLVTESTGITDVEFINHEFSHAAYALYASEIKKEDALIVAIDGYGDDANAFIGTFEKGQIVEQKKYKNFNIGRMYRYITLLLGMKPNEHEYKVMGLAPYTTERMINTVYPIFENIWYFDEESREVKFHEKPQDHYFYFKDKFDGKRFDAIAGALQKYSEKMIVDLVSFWAKKLGKRKVVLSGGVALNIKANKSISELEIIDDIYVPASGGDESLCIGAIFAYLDKNQTNFGIKPLKNMYLGNENSEEVIKNSINEFMASHSDKFLLRENVSNKEIAQLIADGNIVGRCVGRMEFGARALGNRSILANPGLKNIVRKINSQIKHRDFWMPFTPSMIDYKADEYLINPKNIRFPFMTIACDTTKKAHEDIFGALHPADLTSRPQIVTKEINAGYWDLLNEFHKISGIGAFLNTSLNLSGLPICETPEDVFHVLLNSDLDMVLIDKCLIFRKR